MAELVLTILSACFVLFYSTWVSGTTITSCAQTPYPEVCNYFIASNSLATQKDQTLFIFRDQSLLVTMNQAKQVHQAISTMDLSSFNPRAKLAWSDCLDLYDDTIYLLNQSMTSTNPIDSQTWLSASIANQQTCLNGFIDFNLDSHLKYFQSTLVSNFSKLLSNSLAINKDTIPSPSTNLFFSKVTRGSRKLLVDEFPSWVSASDRKLLQSVSTKADVIVAQDGSGHYKTIAEALASSAGKGGGRFVIYVKRGVYKENVVIERSMKNIMMTGDGIDATIVSGNKNAQDGSTTFGSATFAISGSGFIAKDMTFENTAGPQKYQAVALRSGSDFSVFYSCSFKGHQDTLYVYTMRQFYRNCDIYGTVDFIFGDAVVVFQNSIIYIRKPMSGQQNTVTAQSRNDPNENTGIVIHNSIVTASSDLRPYQGSIKSYLGRPWKEYSRTVFMKCTIDRVIDPAGWLPWSGSFALGTLYYAEYMNTGAGAFTSGRVKWPGYHVLKSPLEAAKFTVGNFLAGDSWLPATGVPFDSGL